MKRQKGYTLVELMIVILIVAILCAISAPILYGRIISAKWSEGKTMAGTLASAIRSYIAYSGDVGTWDKTTLGYKQLGFLPQDFDGMYFKNEDFFWVVQVVQVPPINNYQLQYNIMVYPPEGLAGPPGMESGMQLNQTGLWGPIMSE